jgi:uncharacterized YigZ family protein
MLFDNTFKTILNSSEALFKDKGSKFIAYAHPVATEQDAKDFIRKIKEAHPKASHHCYAYRLKPDKQLYRINDDGEPNGSAGKPIYNVLLANDLTNTIIIVVRYFGGTLLGIPGLINAYREAAAEAIKNNTIIEKPITEKYSLTFEYDTLNNIMPLLKVKGVTILNQNFGEQCNIEFKVEKLYAEKIISSLTGNYLLREKIQLKVVM